MKHQDKLELIFASLIAVSVIVSLIFAIAIINPEQGVLQGTQSAAAPATSIRTSVSLSTDTLITLITETASTTITYIQTSVFPTYSTQVITFTKQITETLGTSSTRIASSSPANTTRTQLTSQNASTTISSATDTTSTHATTSISTSTATSTVTSISSSSTVTTTGSTSSVSPIGTLLSLSCSPSEFQLGSSTLCTTTVTGTNWGLPPTGVVSFTSTLPGAFSPLACTLKGAGPSSCSSTFTPKGPTTGYYTVTASYRGDAAHIGSSGSATLIVPPPEPTLISCYPNSLAVNATTYCLVMVENTVDFPIPTGTVAFTSNMPGSFDKISCILDSTGSCSVHYTPAKGSAGFTATITASYNGDLYHAPGSGTTQLSVT